MQSYQSNIAGEDVDLVQLVEGLRKSFGKSKDGDLSQLECMLIGQAMALQSIFTSLARRAQVQEYQRYVEAFLTDPLCRSATDLRDGTGRNVERGRAGDAGVIRGASVQPHPAKVAQCSETASDYESKATPPGKVATSVSCAKSHLSRLRSLVGLTREAMVSDGPQCSQGAQGMLGVG
jgi:hypothetical protein